MPVLLLFSYWKGNKTSTMATRMVLPGVNQASTALATVKSLDSPTVLAKVSALDCPTALATLNYLERPAPDLKYD